MPFLASLPLEACAFAHTCSLLTAAKLLPHKVCVDILHVRAVRLNAAMGDDPVEPPMPPLNLNCLAVETVGNDSQAGKGFG